MNELLDSCVVVKLTCLLASRPRAACYTTSSQSSLMGCRMEQIADAARGRRRFLWFAAGVLAYNIAVILWGAFVRATGSGAGCGSHWPVCNGAVLPRAESVETLIEFAHRTTSGVALVLVVLMFVWARRLYPAGHLVRMGARLSLIFIITEALLGAGLVLFELVAHNESLARAVSMGLHLVNTFILLATLTLTCWWASGGGRPALRGGGWAGKALLAALVGMIIVGATGAIIALGDTLISQAEGRALGPLATVLRDLRPIHPLIALAVSVYVVIVARMLAEERGGRLLGRLSLIVSGLVLLQIGAGALNVALSVPVWMQIVHLLLADLLWIALVLLSAVALSQQAGVKAASAMPAQSPAQ